MRAEDHRLAPLLEVDDEVFHLAGADRVESAGGLVENHELGVVDERLSHANAAGHALGILAELPLLVAAQADHLDERVGPLLSLFWRHVKEPSVEVECLLGIEKLVEIRLLWEIANAFVLRHVGGIATEDERLTRTRKDEAEQQLDGRGLARAVGAEQAEDLTPPNLEIERLEGHFLAASPEVAIGLGEIPRLDDDVALAAMCRCGGRCRDCVHDLD